MHPNELTEMLIESGFEYTSDLLANMHKFKKLVEIEREACAKVCDETSEAGSNVAYMLAKAIRKRGSNV